MVSLLLLLGAHLSLFVSLGHPPKHIRVSNYSVHWVALPGIRLPELVKALPTTVLTNIALEHPLALWPSAVLATPLRKLALHPPHNDSLPHSHSKL